MTQKDISNTLSVLDKLDKKGLFNPDLNLGNILYRDSIPTIIDLEWQTSMSKAGEMFVFAYNEKKGNMIAYEGTGLCGYIKELYSSTIKKESYQRTRQECRDFLRVYFMKRAQYCDTSNRFERVRKAVYQNPSDDVLDAEILRLSILKNHEKQFTYLDKNIEKPRDMLGMIRYQARANLAAKQLSEFQPQGYASDDEREYFSEMRDFGNDWYTKTQNWYDGSIRYMKILVTGEERQDSGSGYFYFPDYFGSEVCQEEGHLRRICVNDKTKLSDILSDGSKAKWDKIMDKNETINYRGRDITLPSLKDQIRMLEYNFMELKKAVNNRDYDTLNNKKEEISKLIPQVLI